MNGKTVKENSRLYEQYNGHSTQDRSSKLVVQHLTMVLMQIFFFLQLLWCLHSSVTGSNVLYNVCVRGQGVGEKSNETSYN